MIYLRITSLQNKQGFTLIELLIVLVVMSLLFAFSVPMYNAYSEDVEAQGAVTDIVILSQAIDKYYIIHERYPSSLSDLRGKQMTDPWGKPYQYLNIGETVGNGKVRKDHSLVPINSDYDLYSSGADGASQSPLTAKASRDDIVRANNGSYIGLASEY